MSIVVTITFSPCIDRSVSVPKLIPGQKLKCRNVKLEPGGGGVNVARAIWSLGGDVTAIYPAGGYTGRHFNKLIAEENIPSLIIETQNETRENFIVLDASTNNQYRFGMPGTELLEKEWIHILDALEKMTAMKFIVASGSLPEGVPDDIFARIAGFAKSRDVRFILDSPGKPLQLAMSQGLYLIKPNLKELSGLAGKDIQSQEDVFEYSREIIRENKVKAVVVSMGSSGACIISPEVSEFIPAPQVRSVSAVGAGDSMVAGIVHKLAEGCSLRTAVYYGVACGAAATLKPGTELCSKEDADALYKQINKTD